MNTPTTKDAVYSQPLFWTKNYIQNKHLRLQHGMEWERLCNVEFYEHNNLITQQ